MSAVAGVASVPSELQQHIPTILLLLLNSKMYQTERSHLESLEHPYLLIIPSIGVSDGITIIIG